MKKAIVLDPCCGGKMFYFDKNSQQVLFVDKRSETMEIKDVTVNGGIRQFSVAPDMIADFTKLPFCDSSFAHVVFDPPHLLHAGKDSWLARKYGTLTPNWQTMIKHGFSECFRVLTEGGTLVFKWSEIQVPVSEVLALTPFAPLYGNRSARRQNTHWIVFIKEEKQ